MSHLSTVPNPFSDTQFANYDQMQQFIVQGHHLGFNSPAQINLAYSPTVQQNTQENIIYRHDEDVTRLFEPLWQDGIDRSDQYQPAMRGRYSACTDTPPLGGFGSDAKELWGAYFKLLREPPSRLLSSPTFVPKIYMEPTDALDPDLYLAENSQLEASGSLDSELAKVNTDIVSEASGSSPSPSTDLGHWGDRIQPEGSVSAYSELANWDGNIQPAACRSLNSDSQPTTVDSLYREFSDWMSSDESAIAWSSQQNSPLDSLHTLEDGQAQPTPHQEQNNVMIGAPFSTDFISPVQFGSVSRASDAMIQEPAEFVNMYITPSEHLHGHHSAQQLLSGIASRPVTLNFHVYPGATANVYNHGSNAEGSGLRS